MSSPGSDFLCPLQDQIFYVFTRIRFFMSSLLSRFGDVAILFRSRQEVMHPRDAVVLFLVEGEGFLHLMILIVS